MMTRQIYLFLLLVVAAGSVVAQTAYPKELVSSLAQPDPVGKRTTVQMDDKLAEVLNRPHSMSGKKVEGYRIYIFRDNSQYGRAKAREVISKFRNSFPDIPGDTLIYQNPDWKVAVGNCLTMDEAVIVFGRVKNIFPSAVIRQEELPLSDFLRMPITTKETEVEIEEVE